MKSWEKKIIETRKKLWLVTTFTEKLVCTSEGGEFYTKATLPQLIDKHYIVSSEKI